MVFKEVRLRKVKVISTSIFLGTLAAIIALIGAFITAILVLSSSLAADTVLNGIVVSIGLIFVAPVFSWVAGFIVALVLTPFFNFALRLMGGIKLDLHV